MIGPHPTNGRAHHCIACADAWLQRGQALINQLRALMLERGITVPQGRRKLERYLPEILADERNGLGPRLRRLIEDVREEWRSIHQRIKGYNDELAERVHNEEAARRLTWPRSRSAP